MTIFRRDYFDAEWFVQMQEYHVPLLPRDGLLFSGVRRHGSKWTTPDGTGGWVGDTPLQKNYISSINPISGLASLILENAGNTCHSCFSWDNCQEPGLGVILVNPLYLHLKFRIDEWSWPGAAAWQIGLAGFSGTPQTWSPYQMAIGFIGGWYPPVLNNPNPHLILKAIADQDLPGAAKTEPAPMGSQGRLSTLIYTDTPLELNRVYDLEIMRYNHPSDGKIGVWLDGELIPFLSFDPVPISFCPQGIRTVHFGSSNTIGISIPNLAGAHSKIAVDDYVTSDLYIGTPQPTPEMIKLTIDCEYQIAFYLGTNGPFYTPKRFYLPKGTVPKIFVEPDFLEHFEINGVPMIDAGTGEYWKEIWDSEPAVTGPPSTQKLVGLVNQARWGTGGDIRSITPPIYTDTLISVVYTQPPRPHTLLQIETVDENNLPVTARILLDEEEEVTPYSRLRAEGKHQIHFKEGE